MGKTFDNDLQTCMIPGEVARRRAKDVREDEGTFNVCCLARQPHAARRRGAPLRRTPRDLIGLLHENHRRARERSRRRQPWSPPERPADRPHGFWNGEEQ